MGWSCVTAIKNNNNQMTFVTFPVDDLVISQNNFTMYNYTVIRGITPVAFANANAFLNLALETINNGAEYFYINGGSRESGTFYTNVFGNDPGKAIVFRSTQNYYEGARLDVNLLFTRYTSLGNSVQIGSESISISLASHNDKQLFVPGFIINSGESKIYPCRIFAHFQYGHTSHAENYYDRVIWDLYICNDSNSNLWDLLHDSVPGEGGEVYPDGDYTEHIGGDGGYDDHSDVIDTSPIPIAAATRSGMITAFVPTWGEIQDVASALLDPNIFQILSSTVVKPSDVIIGLSTFPCTIPANSTATVSANFLGINIGTGIVAHVADNQYVEINCGNLTIDEYWGNCLDYNPYTQISIFLPFCGMYELDADEVMRKTINVSYRIDIFSGACLATIKINGSVYYQYTGQCSAQIPLNSVSFDNFLASMIELGVATATGAGAIKGASAAVAEAENNFREAKASEIKEATDEYFEAKNNYTKVKEDSGAKIFGASVNSVVSGKGFYAHAGAVGGSPGFLAVRTPFLIIKRPEQVIPSMYGKFHGYPANTTAKLGVLWGYTEIADIRLNIPDATIDEIIETEQLLKGGVVL